MRSDHSGRHQPALYPTSSAPGTCLCLALLIFTNRGEVSAHLTQKVNPFSRAALLRACWFAHNRSPPGKTRVASDQAHSGRMGVVSHGRSAQAARSATAAGLARNTNRKAGAWRTQVIVTRESEVVTDVEIVWGE